MRNVVYPLTIFYDASCRLCRTEMESVQYLDRQDRLILVDCASEEFDDSPYRTEGITKSLMLNCMHIRDAEGQWFRGVDAFEQIYDAIDLPVVATLWSSRFTRPFTERAYPWVVRNRYWLSKTGLPWVLKCWGRFAANRAEKRSRACADGICASN